MSTVKERFDELVAKRDSLKTQKIQLEAKISSTKETMKDIEDQWKNDFNVNSYEEAVMLESQITQQIDSTMDVCEEYLKGVGF